jgi:hypothetical protein
MAVANCWELAGSGSVDVKGQREYTRNFRVQMQNYTDVPPNTWGSGFASIARYSSYPSDTQALATTLDCTPESDLGFFHISIKYSTHPFDNGNQSQNPTNSDQSVTASSRPWVIKFGAVHTTRLLTKDVVNGKAVANSAGQPFEPTINIESSHLTISIEAFKDMSFDPVAKCLTYQDSINNAALLMLVSPATTTTFPARSLRCNEYAFESVYDNGASFWKMSLVLEYRWELWNPIYILDAGTHYIKSMALPVQPVVDLHGQPSTTPMPLDGTGKQLTASQPFVYLPFSGYNECNFATILQ